RIDDLDVVSDLDVTRGNHALARLRQPQRDFTAAVELEHNALQVQQQVDHVFTHAVERGVLVEHSFDRHFGRRVAGKRRQEDAPQRIPQRMAKAALERLHRHPRLNRRGALDVDDARFQQYIALHQHFLGTRRGSDPRLTGVQFHDQAFVDRCRQFAAHRVGLERALAGLDVDFQPLGEATRLGGLEGSLDAEVTTGLLGELDHVTRTHDIRRNIHALAIDQHTIVAHDLARFGTRATEAHAIGNGVQTTLEQLQQVFAGLTATAIGLGVHLAELALEHAIKATDLLLFTQLHARSEES